MVKKYLFLLFALVAMCSCTQNQMARSYGGKMTIELPKGEKLVNATWKESNLFYLTEPMEEGYIPRSKKFRESSNFGVWESEITFVESR